MSLHIPVQESWSTRNSKEMPTLSATPLWHRVLVPRGAPRPRHGRRRGLWSRRRLLNKCPLARHSRKGGRTTFPEKQRRRYAPGHRMWIDQATQIGRRIRLVPMHALSSSPELLPTPRGQETSQTSDRHGQYDGRGCRQCMEIQAAVKAVWERIGSGLGEQTGLLL